ncbi:hypothetical protein [Sphingopyxis sp. 2PD]|uniref:hypothetical protein n=1 Tax=Sphingopyxis sp. 2PD TaxID=2502196 RepID=UPI0010F7AF1D|nr:hypothetical protein [Sphingopyxis sp. 2PD]
MTDPSTHIMVRVRPPSPASQDDERIWAAIERLPIPPDRMREIRDRSDDFIDRIRYAGLSAGIRPAAAGQRRTPSEIAAGIADVARGLDLLERGLGTIEGARQSTAAGAAARSDALRTVHEEILQTIVGTIAHVLPTAIIRDVDVAAALPTYGPFGFSNPWRGAFSRAAGQIDNIARGATPEALRAPKPRDEWFGLLVHTLAGVYEDVTGKTAKAYARGQAVNGAWRPPFCVFVTDLWPLWALGATAPSDSKIRDALAKTTKLLSAPEG